MNAADQKSLNPAMQTTGRTLDHAAGVYDLLAPLMTFGQEARIHRGVLQLLQLSGAAAVLDVGCATGAFTRQIAESAPQARVVGLDAASKMIARANKLHRDVTNLRFVAALGEALPFEDGSFDRIVSSFFFHHVDRGLKRRCLAEMHRVLRPGGVTVVVDVDTPTSWFGRICAWSGRWLFMQDEIRENIQGELVRAFDDSPFAGWRRVSHHSGYISVFVLERKEA